MGDYGVEGQLFARRPLGKIWAGSAALENATGVEGCGKKFQKAADPPFRISNFFLIYVFPKFSVYGKIGILLYIPYVYISHVRTQESLFTYRVDQNWIINFII